MLITEEFDTPGDDERIAIALYLAETTIGSINGKLVLDLACRTGAFARAFARKGALSVGIEGNVENFSQIPSFTNTEYYHDDVRNLSQEVYGSFNVTLCLGLLYHLEPDDALTLLAAMRSVTQECAIIDTHISLDPPNNHVLIKGNKFYGHWYDEGKPSRWSSIGNARSWWFTPDSLRTLCHEAGWIGVTDHPDLIWENQAADRRWWVLT